MECIRLMYAERELHASLQEWKNAGGPVIAVIDAIRAMIDLRVAAALADAQEQQPATIGEKQ